MSNGSGKRSYLIYNPVKLLIFIIYKCKIWEFKIFSTLSNPRNFQYRKWIFTHQQCFKGLCQVEFQGILCRYTLRKWPPLEPKFRPILAFHVQPTKIGNWNDCHQVIIVILMGKNTPQKMYQNRYQCYQGENHSDKNPPWILVHFQS